eukprot:7802751-Pyramimonas_sp.AAC.1
MSKLGAMGDHLGQLSEEELDWCLAERGVCLFEKSGGVGGLGAESTLLASFANVHARRRYRAAWKELGTGRLAQVAAAVAGACHAGGARPRR